MAKQARYAGRELELVNAVIARFGGQIVWNTDLAGWLHGQYPDTFPTSHDANNFLERVGMADFASAHKKDKDGNPLPLRGWAMFRGLRGHEAGDVVHKDERSRYWKIPSRPYSRLITKEEAFARAGIAIPRPLPTRERTTEYYTKAV